jgi:hypothetical protein
MAMHCRRLYQVQTDATKMNNAPVRPPDDSGAENIFSKRLKAHTESLYRGVRYAMPDASLEAAVARTVFFHSEVEADWREFARRLVTPTTRIPPMSPQQTPAASAGFLWQSACLPPSAFTAAAAGMPAHRPRRSEDAASATEPGISPPSP